MIKLGEEKDIECIMKIFDEVKEEFRKENNPQWGSTEENYPNQKRVLSDIQNNNCYLIEEENKIKGFISIIEDHGEYESLVDTSNRKSYVLHRMTVPQEYRHQGIAQKLMHFAEQLAKENNIEVLKADTEKRNTKMNNLFLKLGYEKKGTFIYDDYPGEYIYYEKILGSEEK